MEEYGHLLIRLPVPLPVPLPEVVLQLAQAVPLMLGLGSLSVGFVALRRAQVGFAETLSPLLGHCLVSLVLLLRPLVPLRMGGPQMEVHASVGPSPCL